MKVLILTTKYGNGHHSISTQLQSYFENNGASVTLVNPHRDKNYHITRFVEYVYTDIFCKYAHNPILKKMYAISFELFGNRLTNIFSSFGTKQIANLAKKHEPDLIICTFPMQLPKLDNKVVTLVTDYGLSNVWMSKNTHGYIIGSDQLEASLLEKGATQPIFKCGIPVNPKFTQANNSKSIKSIVFNFGVVGNSKISHLTDEFDRWMENGLKIEVICGKNEKLVGKLSNQYRGNDNIQVHPFVDTIAEIYGRNDLIISKAGGITIAEAIATETPILLNRSTSMSGQEELNITFVREAQIGATYKGYPEIAVAIDKLLVDNEQYQTYVDNMKSLKANYEIDMHRVTNYFIEMGMGDE